jgi:hypothetical protein
MAASYSRKYATGSGADVYINIPKAGSANHAVSADWTPAAGDVKVSVDGGAAANIGTLPTAIAMGNSAIWKFVFTNSELTGKFVSVTVADSATKAVDDTGFSIETYGHASAAHPFDLGAASSAQTGDTYAIVNSGTHGNAALKTLIDTVDDLIDTEVSAIKTKTDQLTFTVANQVDANALGLATSLRPGIRKNVALANFEIVMTDSTTHAPATGKTVTVTRSIDGGAFGGGTLGSVTEISNGAYKFDFGAGDLNGDNILLRATATACDDLLILVKTSP